MRFLGNYFFKKIILGLAIVGLGLFIVGPVLAAAANPQNSATSNGLDWQWPVVPGVGSLAQKSDAAIIQECRDLHPNDLDEQRKCVGDKKGELLGFAVKYFLYLFFYLITGACVIMIILAGASYVTASGKVQKMMTAKKRLSNAAWGILIVASSWALLYIINPNLLLFQTKIPDIPPIPIIEGQMNGSNVTFTTFSVKEMIDQVIASSAVENPETGEMKILEPYRQARAALSEALLILQGDPAFKDKIPPRPGLKKLLEFCQCGQSYSHLEKEGALNFSLTACKSGDEIKSSLEKIKNSGRVPDTKDLCLTRCDNCGTLEGQQPQPKKDEYRPCMLNNVLIVSTKKDPADASKTVPLKCPYPIISLTKPDLQSLWALGNLYVPNNPYAGFALPRDWKIDDESWEKCEFIYYDRTPNTDKPAEKYWAILAVFYPESNSHQKWIEFTSNTLSDTNPFGTVSGMNDDFLAYSIKYHIARLFKIVPQLQAIKLELATDQIQKLGSVLASNAMDYLLFEGHGGIFQPEIDDEKRMLASRGYDVNFQPFMDNGAAAAGLPSPPTVPEPTTTGQSPFWNKFKILAALGSFIQPFQKVFASNPILVEEGEEPSDDRFYVVTNVETFGANISPYDEQMIKQNKLVVREASRANLYTVLADQTLEEVEAMVGDCMASAFGQAQYDLPPNIEEIIGGAIGQGAADYLIYEFAKNNEKFAGLIGQEVADQVKQKAEGSLQKRCAGSCGCASDCVMDDARLKQFIKDNKICVEKCEKENIPPDFVSHKISQFISQPLVLQLPGEIGKDLNSTLKSVLKDSEVIKDLDKNMITLYNKVLRNGLSKSFAEQIPGLKKVLDSNIYVYLTENLSTGAMSKINNFLNFRIGEYLQKKISEQVGRVAGGLTNEFDQLVEKGVDALKEQMPNLFPESIMSSVECNTTELLMQGYLWQPKGCTKLPLRCCKKLTPGAINETADGSYNGGPFYMDDGSGILAIDGVPQTHQMVCEKAGYVWSQYWEINYASRNPEEIPSDDGRLGIKKGDWQCGEDQWVGTDLGGLTDVKQLGKKALAGAIDFVSGFAQALTATIMNTVMAYTDVWIEDDVLAPLEGYISQFSGLQENLKDFLHTSVNDLLPTQISQTLNSNVDKTLKNICAQAPPEPTDPATREAIKGNPQTLTLSLYGEKTYGKTIDMPGELTTNENIWRVCDISQHLNTTLAGVISSRGKVGEAIINTLNSRVVDLIPWEGAKDLLKKSPAELIFDGTPLKDIKALVEGTPVDILCGRLIQFNNGDFRIAQGWPTLQEKCSTMKIKRPISAGGYSSDTITFPETDMTIANKELNPQFWRYVCPIIWGACTMPGDGSIPFVGKTVGQVAKSLLVLGCSLPAQETTFCTIALHDSAAYTLLTAAMESHIPLANRTNEQKQNEIEIYRWLRVSFLAWDTAGVIADVAKSRGIDWAKVTASNAQDYVTLDNVNKMNNGDWLKVLALWRLGAGSTTVGQMLTLIPDGLIKPAKAGDPTMLLPTGSGAPTNILGLTPSQLWQILLPIKGYENKIVAGVDANFICKKLETYYASKYPEFTFKAINDKVIKAHPPALIYSMASLDRPTIAETLGQLADVDNDFSGPYLLCQYLKYSPSQILGLDQELMHYIQPEEYQILFQLINEELSPDERPEFLNQLLSFLNGRTPVSALREVSGKIDSLVQPNGILADHWWYNGSTAAIKFSQDNVSYVDELTDFLDTSLGEYLNRAQIALREKTQNKIEDPEQTIINQLCHNLKDANNHFLLRDICAIKIGSDTALWDKIQKALLNTPADLMAAALPWKIPNPPGWENSICKTKIEGRACVNGEKEQNIKKKNTDNSETTMTACCKQVNSVMDAVGLYWPFLGQPYIDSLFNAAGWTDNMYNFLDERAIDWDNADKRWEKGRSAVASAIDKVVLDEPKALLSNVLNKVANLAGFSIGDGLAEDMAGRCWEITTETPCGGPGQVQRQRDGKNECCDMGGALVCQNKCRLKGEVPCKEKQGEFISNDGQKCCYAFKNKWLVENKEAQECLKCRQLISSEAGGKCARQGEKLFEPKGSNIKLCCKPRVAQETPGGIGVPEGNELDDSVPTPLNKVCCETITECISSKFLDHLEAMKSFLVDGLPINSLFPPKEK